MFPPSSHTTWWGVVIVVVGWIFIARSLARRMSNPLRNNGAGTMNSAWPGTRKPAAARLPKGKPPGAVLFAVWAWLLAMVAIDVLLLVVMILNPGNASWWAGVVIGFVVLLLTLIGAGFALTLRDGDRTSRNFLSYSVVFVPGLFGFPMPWTWLTPLILALLVGPLWLPASRAFFDQKPESAS
jgi:hypothetical protein